jgi:hypothetical protein
VLVVLALLLAGEEASTSTQREEAPGFGPVMKDPLGLSKLLVYGDQRCRAQGIVAQKGTPEWT